MFSKACEYGIRAALLIAQESKSGKKIQLVEIANKIDSPVAFTAKSLQKLSRAGLISAVKGPYGGYFMNDLQRKSQTISDIVKAIDGDDLFTGCALGLKSCDATKPCPLHFEFVKIREQLNTLLIKSKLEGLGVQLKAEKSFLKREY
jgi:Rrf2 family protein